MCNVVLSQIGKNKQQLFDFFISNNYDVDMVSNFEDECEEMIAYVERELDDENLVETQDMRDGSWSYGSRELDNWVRDQESHLEDLRELRDNAIDCYSMVDDYLANLQNV